MKTFLVCCICALCCGCGTPIWTFYPDDHIPTKAGDVITDSSGTYTTKYDGVWMRNEVDEQLHDAKWKKLK